MSLGAVAPNKGFAAAVLDILAGAPKLNGVDGLGGSAGLKPEKRVDDDGFSEFIEGFGAEAAVAAGTTGMPNGNDGFGASGALAAGIEPASGTLDSLTVSGFFSSGFGESTALTGCGTVVKLDDLGASGGPEGRTGVETAGFAADSAVGLKLKVGIAGTALFASPGMVLADVTAAAGLAARRAARMDSNALSSAFLCSHLLLSLRVRRPLP